MCCWVSRSLQLALSGVCDCCSKIRVVADLNISSYLVNRWESLFRALYWKTIGFAYSMISFLKGVCDTSSTADP
jgi:hypothetical protein